MLMTKQLHELSNKELAELLMDTTHQFIDGLRNDAPIEELQILRDYLTAIRTEIRMKDGGRR
jgi:hypothetical protein